MVSNADVAARIALVWHGLQSQKLLGTMSGVPHHNLGKGAMANRASQDPAMCAASGRLRKFVNAAKHDWSAYLDAAPQLNGNASHGSHDSADTTLDSSVSSVGCQESCP